MKPPRQPTDEARRLAALRECHWLDTLPEPAFDELTALVAHLCETPIALIWLVDEKRQWFKSKFGLAVSETPRDLSFCGHAILQSDLFIVPDATKDERFADNPLVTGSPHIRFYAGAPLVTVEGYELGTLNVIDCVPRELTPRQQEMLRVLSRQVMAQLELRRQAGQLDRQTHELAVSSQRLAMLSDINQTIVREKDPRAMLTAACRIAVAKGHFQLAWIGLTDTATGRLQISAHAGATEDTLNILNSLVCGPQPDCVFTYRALHTGLPGICADIAQDSQTASWRAAALERNYQAMASLPLKDGDTVIGTFNLYAGEPGGFDQEELRRLDELAMNISFALQVSRRERERQKAEAELRWRTAFFEAQAESSLDGVLVVGGQGRKILQNARLNELLKIPPEIAANPDDAVQLQHVTRRMKNAGQFAEKIAYLNSHRDEVSRDEIELLDGTILDRTSAPVRDRTGHYYGRIWTFRDITERKGVEKSLARLATAVEQSAEIIVITDTQPRILYVNPAFEKITGYSSKEVIGQNPRLLKSGKQDAAFYQRMWEVLGRGEIWRGHFFNRRKNGTLVEEDATISPMRDSTGRVVNYVAVKRDVTREKQLEEQFRQAQKMEAIGQLAGGVAHDFNNILASIMMQAELAGTEANLPAETRSSLDEIKADAERAANLTRQLLAFSRRQIMQTRPVDLNEIVTSLTKMLQRILGEDVRLQLNLHPGKLQTRADPGMLDQVLLNLVVNARDAMPEGGQLIIDTTEKTFTEAEAAAQPDMAPGRYVSLRVRDTGCGMSREIMARIFEPFFTTKEPGKGTGLGLATVFGIVKQHGGSLAVESQVGQGTTFHIFLRTDEDALTGSLTDQAGPPPRGGTETILLVEDEASVRRLIRVVLERAGYQVLTAANGVEALRVWEQHPNSIQLLFTDLVMPEGVTGRQLATGLQARNPKLRVIFTSGYSSEIAGRELALPEGQNFLQKPAPPKRILEIVRQCLDEK